ncbi:MAG TPA: helix-turn-helix domain-containing protein [Chloroflexota bacterium]|nr:helix-turn-helix domain-containing protein [Chloroflexota bacterium]
MIAHPNPVAYPEQIAYTSRDAAAQLAISERHLRRLVADGQITPIRISEHCVRFRHAELERYSTRLQEAGR